MPCRKQTTVKSVGKTASKNRYISSVFTNVTNKRIDADVSDYNKITQHITSFPIDDIIPVARTEGIQISKMDGEKHRYTCILVQDRHNASKKEKHTLFSYEVYHYLTPAKGTVRYYSKIVRPTDKLVRTFLNNNIDY